MEEMKISKFIFVYWLLIIVFFVIISGGALFPLLLIPIYIYIYLKKLKYYYNKENFYIEKGVFFKNKEIIPIENIDSMESKNIIGFKFINIHVKGRFINLINVKKPINEVQKFTEFKNKINNIKDNDQSTADEILKFKNLLDQGIITQEEFEKKKKELLG